MTCGAMAAKYEQLIITFVTEIEVLLPTSNQIVSTNAMHYRDTGQSKLISCGATIGCMCTWTHVYFDVQTWDHAGNLPRMIGAVTLFGRRVVRPRMCFGSMHIQ